MNIYCSLWRIKFGNFILHCFFNIIARLTCSHQQLYNINSFILFFFFLKKKLNQQLFPKLIGIIGVANPINRQYIAIPSDLPTHTDTIYIRSWWFVNATFPHLGLPCFKQCFIQFYFYFSNVACDWLSSGHNKDTY